MAGDAFEWFFQSLLESGALRPPEDVTAQEMVAARAWAASIWTSWAAWDLAHPHEWEADVVMTQAEVEVAAGQIDDDLRELLDGEGDG